MNVKQKVVLTLLHHLKSETFSEHMSTLLAEDMAKDATDVDAMTGWFTEIVDGVKSIGEDLVKIYEAEEPTDE